MTRDKATELAGKSNDNLEAVSLVMDIYDDFEEDKKSRTIEFHKETKVLKGQKEKSTQTRGLDSHDYERMNTEEILDYRDKFSESGVYIDEIAQNTHEQIEELALHPLLNPDSPHYKMVDGVEAIERMEQMYSTEELMIWANITIMKYRLRIGKKDDVEKEITKIKGYEAYYKYLEGLKKC